MSHKIGIRKGLPALSHTSQRTEGFQALLLPLGAQRNIITQSQMPKRRNNDRGTTQPEFCIKLKKTARSLPKSKQFFSGRFLKKE
jgi:hypothetical protein